MLRTHGYLLGMWKTDQTKPGLPSQGGLYQGEIQNKKMVLWKLDPRSAPVDWASEEWNISDFSFSRQQVWPQMESASMGGV